MENPAQKQRAMRKIGLYVVLVLAALRFVVAPLHDSVENKKTLLKESTASLASAKQLLKAYKFAGGEGDPELQEQLSTMIYPAQSNKTALQTDLINEINAMAHTHHLAALGFGLGESGEMAGLKDFSVIVRLQGGLKPAITLFRELQGKKPLIRLRELEIADAGQGYLFIATLSGYIKKE